LKKNAKKVGLNFSVSPDIRRRYKVLCAQHDMSLVQALERALVLLEADFAKADAGKRI
jgi:hypothetical protein